MQNPATAGRGRLRARLALLSVTTALASGLAAPAAAQYTPPRQVIDERAIDVVSGQAAVSGPSISTGAARFTQRWQGKIYANPLLSYIFGNGAGWVVYIDGVSKSFVPDGSGGFAAADQDGSSLTALGSDNFKYVAADGTTYSFMAFPVTGIYFGNPGKSNLTSIKYPDGRVDDYRYKTVTKTQYIGTKPFYSHFFRIQSIVQSGRYLIKPTYASNTTDADFYKLLSVATIDLSADYCSPTADACTSLTQAWPTTNRAETTSGGSTTTTMTDPDGNPTVVATDTNGVTGVTPPAGPATGVTYDGAGRTATLVDNGVTTTYTYADAGSLRTTTATTAGANRTYITDIASARLVSMTDETGRTTSYQYDTAGRRTRETRPEGDYTQWTYDARGNVTETRQVAKPGSGLADILTIASFDATCTNVLTCNQPNYTIDARGNRTDYTYDAIHGGVTQVLRPAAISGGVRPRVDYSYTALFPQTRNSSGTLVAGTTPQYLPTQITACATAATCAGTASETKVTLAYATPTLQLTSRTVAAGDGSVSATVSYTYDLLGNVASMNGPLAGSDDTSYYFYTPNRDLRGSIGPDPDGSGPLKRRAVRYTYDPARRRIRVEVGTATGTAITSLTGMTVLQQSDATYDANGNVTKDAISASGATYMVTQYGYDARNRLECTAQRMNAATFASLPASACSQGTAGTFGPDRIGKTTYDAAGRVLKLQSAYGTTSQADEATGTYSSNGQLATLTDAENNTTTYEYDGQDRLVKTRFPLPARGSRASSTTDYEELGYDAAGDITSRRLRDATSIAYSYDALGRLVTKDLPGGELDVSYDYDLLNRPVGATTSGQALGFTYDALGRSLAQSGPLGTVTSQYDAAGRRTRLTWPDAFYVTTDYLITGETAAIREYGAASGVGVLATFGYDDLGWRTSLTRGNGTTTIYTFDPVSRLSSLGHDLASSASDLTLGFAYNPSGQITTSSRDNDTYAFVGLANRSDSYSVNGLNQATAAGNMSLGHDGRGNTTAIGSASYTYSSENLLLTGPNSAALAYDPLMRLYQTGSASSVTTRFQYDGVDMIGEYDTSSVLQRRFVHGPGADEPLVWYEGSGTTDRRWLHADERGSVIATSDASGGRLSINSYDEYGVPAINNIGRFGYTGQKWIPELNFYDYKARIYAPGLGGFLQTDPIGYADGMNWYNYVGSDPVNLIDPSGLQEDGGGVVVTAKTCKELGRKSNGHGGCVVAGPKTSPLLNIFGSSGGGGAIGVTAVQGAPQNNQDKKPAKTKTQCALEAFGENWQGLALDGLGALAIVAFPEGSAATAIAGSVIGVLGIASATKDRDVLAGGIAYTGKQAAAAEGLLRGAASAVGHRIGVRALIASTAYDAAKSIAAYKRCMAGE